MSAARLSNLAKNVKELRIHFSQTSPASKGVRDFVLNNYVAIKKANPTLPILVREAEGVEARAFARFDRGVERKSKLEGLSEAEVSERLAQLTQA